ncbi:MAG: cysteine desulfurase [Hyphomicrobiaceae bacterium]|nr:cysteine desulfurase [Hyphomicrobiaceae bacterium]
MTSSNRIYLDYNASAPLRNEARAAMMSTLDIIGNPSSVHTFGRKARCIIEEARESVATLVGVKPANVFFTSGATEANNWFFRGGWETALVSSIEHDSVLEPIKRSRINIKHILTSSAGVAQVEELSEMLLSRNGCNLPMCASLQMANNETGAIQPVAKLASFCRYYGIAMHSDAAQAAGRVKIKLDELGVDTLSLSSHKIGGPSGVGALVIRDGFDLPALMLGGGQEHRKRSGTENVIGIAGFGAAANSAVRDLKEVSRFRLMRDRIEHNIKSITPEAVIIASDADRLVNTSCISLPGKSAETLLIKLDLKGFAVSSGAACSSGKVNSSHVLSAMGLTSDIIRGAIRISVGWNSSEAEISSLAEVWSKLFS